MGSLLLAPWAHLEYREALHRLRSTHRSAFSWLCPNLEEQLLQRSEIARELNIRSHCCVLTKRNKVLMKFNIRVRV